MNNLQSKLLDMFKWFHNVCEENGLKYYALGGTMLGAVRHRGFIPWDDDIDFGMPREDYEKFLLLMHRRQDKQYVIETPYTEADDYCYAFAKIYNTQTTLIENTRQKIKRGIYIDVFPLDGMENTKISRKMHYFTVYVKKMIFGMRETWFNKKRTPLKSFILWIVNLPSKKLLSGKKLLQSIDRSCKKRSFEKCTYLGNLLGAWGTREIMPKSYMGTPTLYQFENISVYGVEQPDLYLTSLYGDWRKLPPKEKQKSHHDFILLDLNTPYIQVDEK